MVSPRVHVHACVCSCVCVCACIVPQMCSRGTCAIAFLGFGCSRQTVLIWDTNPHTPRLYFKPAPPLHLPRRTDLLGLHRLIAGMESTTPHPLSPVDPWRLSYIVGTLGVITSIVYH